MTKQLWRYLHVFCDLLSDGFFQIMCIASFNFNLNGVEVGSIISKQFSVLSALQVSLFTRCIKMCDFLSVSKCYLVLIEKWWVVSPM